MANWLERIFRKNEEIEWMYDFDLAQKDSERAYLKKLAIQICVNHIADTVSQSRFKIQSKDDAANNHIEYLLNRRPNRNQNASQFWQQVIYKLINDNEVLIIKTDSEELVIASDFTKNEAALYDTIFKEVKVGEDFVFTRNFKMSDVFYLEYSNGQMKQIIDGLFDDYGEVFGRLVQYQLHANQLRATYSLGTIGRKNDKTKDKFQDFIDKLTQAFKNTVAVVPLQDGTDYKEHSSGGSGQSVEEVNRALNGFIDKVAMALKIPKNLLYGDMADTTEASKNYMKFCINPLLKQISDEFTSKLFERKEIEEKDYKLEIYPLSLENIFDRAQAIDKLVSSGTFTRNEVRVESGKERSDDPEMDKFIITKNYQRVEEASEGGETNT